MKLYVIRHAIAMERSDFVQIGQDDDLRPLTPKGVERMHGVFSAFKKNEEHIEVVLQSPLVRCQQTGDLMKEYYPNARYLTTQTLRPNHSAQKLHKEIQSFGVNSMTIIGHEPDLGQFISWLLFRQASDQFPMKKGGIARLDLHRDGRCYLKWMLWPKLILQRARSA